MSLRVKLIALFAAVLVLTMGVAALLAGPIVKIRVTEEIGREAQETAKVFATELVRLGTVDQKRIEEFLKSRLNSSPGLRSIEVAKKVPEGGELRPDPNVIRVLKTSGGVEVAWWSAPPEIPEKAEEELVEGPEGRFYNVSVKGAVGKSPARITLQASLTDADKLVDSERRVFLWVTAVFCLFLILATHLLLLRLIGRPIGQLTQAMSDVERGNLQVQVNDLGNDELALLGRGFNEMIGRIRGFSAELTTRVNEAVADVAQKNRALEELNDLLVAARRDLNAKERLAALGQLSGTLAHELGNPLNVISGNLQLLSRRPDLAADTRDDLHLLQDEVARMTGIIRRFLDSTRGLKPTPERVELSSLIHEAMDLCLSAEVRARLETKIEVEEGLDQAELDPGLVRHVITNFVTNAVDAMPNGGRLSVGARRSGDELGIWVSDTGQGMTPDQRKHIFEPFYTTKAKGKGTGLGLSICREISMALQGHIEVESQLGSGSTFSLRLPWRGAEPALSRPPLAADLAEAKLAT